ncbi:MAG: sigma-70 family RNA polymerase sigma factor [Rhodopirellula sp. JB044]|uniref:sigma-70 family RNA polymerase sigma factor n=1 Tax=Rhodopirellula sp. JB044 TaxID=3342844 RepID=UPI00370C9E93
MDNRTSKVELPVETFLLLTDAQANLFGFLLKRLGNKDYAHEVLQNVNLTICKKSASFVPGTNFMAWAYAIARIELMSFRRELSSERMVFTEDLESKMDLTDAMIADDTPLDLRKEALEECLTKLNPRERQIVTLRYAESVPVIGIAKQLNRTANAISLSLHRIREKLLVCVKRQTASGLDEQ